MIAAGISARHLNTKAFGYYLKAFAFYICIVNFILKGYRVKEIVSATKK